MFDASELIRYVIYAEQIQAQKVAAVFYKIFYFYFFFVALTTHHTLAKGFQFKFV